MSTNISRPEGIVTLNKVTLEDGKVISVQEAVDRGFISGVKNVPSGWGVGRDEALLGKNLFLDNGRQLIAFLLGFRAPIQNYTIQNFGVGTGISAPNVADVNLEAPAFFNSTQATVAPVDSIDYLAAFVLRVNFTIALTDCNGLLLTELGLFSGNNTLMARIVRNVPISKISTWSPGLTWRIRT